MSSHWPITCLKLILGAGLAAAVLLQVMVLPWIAAWMAQGYPEAAHMRLPVLMMCILGLVCVEVVFLATWRLLDAVRQSRIFDPRSFRWVDCIITALVAVAALSMAMLVYLMQVGLGPISVPALALLGAVTALGAALLMVVMRALLRQATTLKTDLDGVI